MPSGIFTLKQQAQARSEGAWTGSPPTTLNYLVVAGGGGGGNNYGGGGGGGGLLQGNLPVVPGTSYTVTVGAGGSSDTNGGSSVFSSITSTGGGAGGQGRQSPADEGNSGGSGGGAGAYGVFGAQGTSGQGFAGGRAFDSGSNGGGGGGGAGTIGLNGPSGGVSGNGGAGIASDISGTRTAYAGGGGGGGATGGSGGAGGGGEGATSSGSPTSGGGNTGGGGGGGNFPSGSGGSGGSGIVIVSYPGTTQWFTGGTLSYANGNIIHTFYSSGTLAPTAPSDYINTGYEIERSLRFNSADSAYLSRTPSSNGNQRTATFSAWIKRGKLGAELRIFTETTGSGSGLFWLYFNTSDQLQVAINGATGAGLTSTQVFRDPSAWYHIVAAVDTTQATSSDRIKLYVNNVQITAFSGTQTYYTQNETLKFNVTSSTNLIGYSNTATFDGYMTEVNWIDGQALTPSSFGYTNPTTGVWSPLEFVGTYGTNGFYLNFSDNSSTAALGTDYSGNGNTWTVNNFSVTAGAGNDSLVDTPTPYGTDTGAGGEVRGNYCTWNSALPAAVAGSSIVTLSNGNLDIAFLSQTVGDMFLYATSLLNSGKWYWEFTISATTNNEHRIGVSSQTFSAATGNYEAGYRWAKGTVYVNGTQVASGLSTCTTNDVIGVAIDAVAGTVQWFKNNTSVYTATGVNYSTYIPYMIGDGGSGRSFSGTTNFGQRPFAYTAPSGFKALCTQNLPEPTVVQGDDYFNTVLFTATGSSQAITGVGFTPDFVWWKARSNVRNHALIDQVRGGNKYLSSNVTSGDQTYNMITSWDSDGFTAGSGALASGETNVAWNWKANGSGVSNTAGSITSTVSANTTAGFSVATFTTPGSGTATVGHGLGVAPKMIIVKSRANTGNWNVYHASLGATKYLELNTTSNAGTNSDIWADTEPTSSVFTVGVWFNTLGGNCVAYCFAEVAGFSAFGSYTGNGSTDGPFVYTGFRPAFVMIKQSSAAGEHWVILDNDRNTSNVENKELYANLANAESSNAGNATLDFVSNGFKIRTTNAGQNTSSATYIYACFAESPFRYSLAR